MLTPQAAAALEIGKKRPREPSTADTDLLLVPFAPMLCMTLFFLLIFRIVLLYILRICIVYTCRPLRVSRIDRC